MSVVTKAELLELKSALEAERAARRQALEDSDAKSELLATVSHELRTPMGAIISMADLLLTTALDPTQRKYAETLQQSTRGLLSVLNDILDYSKLNSSTFALDLEPFELDKFMETLETALRAHAGQKGLNVEVTRDSGLPNNIVGDTARIRQILNNLLSNAIKFTDEGSIRLSASIATCDDAGGLMKFEVADTGVGIPATEHAMLFERFSQGSNSGDNDRGGTGLGLSIARALAEKMGGDLNFTSAEGSGSTFWFTVRFEHAEPRQPTAEMEQNTPAAVSAKTDKCVLVVDDNKVNQMLISAFLEKFGYGFELAGSGQDAIQMATNKDYDVILMDIRMPGMDGMETTRRLHDLQGEQTPVIALTAHAIDGSREACLEAGMVGFVTKPIDPRSLHAALLSVLDPNAEELVDTSAA